MTSIIAIIVALLVIAIGLFFSSNEKKKEEEVYDAPPVPSKSPGNPQCVLVLGAGTIGSSFTAVFLARGMKVINVDPVVSREVLAKRVQEAFPYLVARGITAAKEAPLDALTTHDSISEAIEQSGGKITFVQECTWEQVENKQNVLAELDGLLDPTILIASSTSYIPWTLISSNCQHKHRILIGHPTIPHVGAFMEVYGISPEWALHCKEWYTDAAFDCIVMKKSIPGHVFNSILRVNMQHGYKLVREGVCSVDDVNLAMRYWSRGVYTSHIFISLLIGIGGDRGVEGGMALVEKIKNDAVFLVLYSRMIGKGIPDLLAQPVGKLLGRFLVSLLPDRPEELITAAKQMEEVITDRGKIPITTALFNARADVYKKLPFEVDNDPFRADFAKSN